MKDWLSWLRGVYTDCVSSYADAPYMSPVLRAGLAVNAMLADGRLDMAALDDMVAQLRISSLCHRAQALADYLGTCDVDDNRDRLDAVIRHLAADDQGGVIGFDAFQARLQHVYYTLVLTAHPTFTMPLDEACALASMTAHIAQGAGVDSDAFIAHDEQSSPAPDLEDEEAYSLVALDNLHAAYDRLLDAVLDVAAALYPQRWRELEPVLFTAASWVGFDLDGRADIQWAQSMEKRITLQIRQLDAYACELNRIIQHHPHTGDALSPALDMVQTTLAAMRDHQAFFAAYHRDADPALAKLQASSRALVADAGQRLISPGPLLEYVQACLDTHGGQDDALARDLIKLRARLANFGLSRAEMHFRINANQLHNAINTQVELTTHPDHASRRHSYLAAISQLIETATPINIDFGDIANERITAKYEFMLIQQITSYIDSHSPVRFLIAESESAFTVLTALYYARRFGVADTVDICPLFETRRALRDGGRYIQHMLKTPAWRDYMYKRGRLCVQLGYSDSGRYIGQPPAGASIERLKERITALAENEGAKNCKLVLFDTHGESPGRGAHPDDITARLSYIAPPQLLKRLRQAGLSCTHESSYQGGDGMLALLNSDCALAVLTGSLCYFAGVEGTGDAETGADDPYYSEPHRSAVTELFTVMTNFQIDLVADSGYADLLNSFSTNMIYPLGSRAAKRAATAGEPKDQRPTIGQYRAIPHNAILGQLGHLATTIAGMGRALREHADLAGQLTDESPRYRHIMRGVALAARRSDPAIMKAYITLLDPTFWLICARQEADVNRADKLAEIATQLEQHDMHDNIMRVFRRLDWDDTLLRRYFGTDDTPVMRDIACLHAIRIALVYHCFVLAADIPRFAPGYTVSREQLMQLVFHMDIASVSRLLDEIFPADDTDMAAYDFGETSQYRQEQENPGYTNIREQITDPLLHMHDMCRRISTTISHYLGFIG